MKLTEKLASVYATIISIEKLGENDKQHYRYVRAADVTNAVRAELIKLKVYAEINYEFVGGPYTVARSKDPNAPFTAVNVRCSIIFHDLESTETITSSGLGSGCDNNDKAAYKAQTGALKYALKNSFLIPDEADPEADSTVDEEPDYVEPQRQPAAARPAARPTPAAAPKPTSGATAAATSHATASTQPAEHAVATPVKTTESTMDPGVAPSADGPLPTEEELEIYRVKFQKLGDDLSSAGKLKSSKGLPINRKLIVFLQDRTGMPDVKVITKAQWDDFFQRVDAKVAEDNGLVNLGVLINRVNGVEAKKK